MLPQRLRWLLPAALIVSWMSLQLGAALPARDERSHVSPDTFDPSAAASTMTRLDHDGRARHPPSGKNETQSGHKLVASPAGLLRPDKFQFYTYDDKGDMITRQMTAQEIQGLIAAGGADHVAMDRQEPQKADDVLTGGKKVMDVVQKVQNVLKSALDKPPTLTGSIPKIPEHANVEWSNILPSILSGGETDAISPNSESSQSSHKITAEKTGAGGAPNTGAGILTSKHPTKKPDVQTNAYAGFTNNIQEKPQLGHYSQQTAVTEKPMIPVPVITLTEQKLSTLQSAVTESPVFQMLSVIPVESVATKGGQTDSYGADAGAASSATTQVPAQTEGLGQTGQLVEVTLSEVPEGTTFPQLTSLDIYPVSITKQTTAGSKVGQGSESPAASTATPGLSTDSSITKQTHDGTGESTSATDGISTPPSASYVLVTQRKNDTEVSEDSSFDASGVTKGSQASGAMHNYDKIMPQTDTRTSPMPLSHAPPRPVEVAPNETAPHSPSTLAPVTGITAPTVPTSLHTFTVIPDHYLGDSFSTVTKESPSPVTPTYGENYRNPLPTEIQSPAPVEPLPTQLIDSFSSVINQVSEVKPPVLPLSSAPNEMPAMPFVSINHDPRRNAPDSSHAAVGAQHDTAVSHGANDKNVAGARVTVTTQVPSQDATTKLADYTIAYRPLGGESSAIGGAPTNSRITAATSAASTRTTNSEAATSNLATTPAGLESTGATIPGSTTSPSVQLPLVKTDATAAASPVGQAEGPATPQSVADGIALSEKTGLPASTTPGAAKTQSTAAPIGPNVSLKPTTTDVNFDNALASLNLSDPVSAIDQVLSLAPLPSNIPAIEPIGLPSDTSNFVASGLASGLIAGFATSDEKIGDGQTAKDASSERTKLAQESVGDITKINDETAGLDLNDQRERNVTQATRETLTGPAGNGTLIYDTLTTKESNDTLEPTKLSSTSEGIDDSTKASSSSPADKFADVNDESKDSVGQSSTTAGVVTVNPGQTTTTVIRSPDVDETVLGTSDDQRRTEIREKMKTTEAPIVRTDSGPVIPVKVANDTKNSGHAESSPKIEALGEKVGSLADAPSVTRETVAVRPVNDSTPVLYSSHAPVSNVTRNTSASNVTSNDAIKLVSNRNPTNPAFPQNLNRVNGAVGYKNKNSTNIQDNKDDNNRYSSPLPIQEHTDSPIVKIVTQESTSDATVDKGQITRPDDSDSANNTSSENDKNVAQTTSSINASTQSDGHSSNNLENKTASLKHSESSPKPDVIRLQASTPASSVPVRQTTRPAAASHRPSEKLNATKVDADVNTEDKWTLISQQAPPAMSKLPKPPKPPKPLRKPINHVQTSSSSSSSNSNEGTHVRSPGAETAAHQQDQHESSTQSLLPLDASQSAIGLDVTTRHTSADIINFAKLCNELAFNFWAATNKGLSTARSLALSPFGMTSLLAMIFLGARGPTSDQMNEVLGLDDVATFNPHLVFQNITDTVSLARGQGIANAAFVRELFADKMKVRKLMPFYKEQAQQFYEGLVAEVNFATISDLVRRRTNLLIRKQTGGRIKDFVKTNTVPLRSPLAALSANVFQTDCNSSLTSSVGRDGELYFAVSPAVRQRKLVPVPATTWQSGVLAGYEPSIDATVVALGGSDRLVSTIFMLPGQQGHTAPGDNLDRLEQRLVRSAFRDGAWNKLLKVLIPRNGLELQVPKFSHRSVVNATAALKRMGLDELFSGNADFKGINGVGHRLHLADVLQMNLFSTCGDENILSGRHHVETYPASPLRRNVGRRLEDTDNSGNIAEEDTSRYGASSHEDNLDSSYTDRSRVDRYGFYREEKQLSGLERPRLKLDRPFLYFVRHNPSGIILYMGRFNPRLLP